MVRLALWVALALPFSAAVYAAENPNAELSIGVARMLVDGTILVGVPGPEAGSRARAVLMVEPGDTNYQSIIDHVGGLKPGETKSIPPWPDSPPSAPRKDSDKADPTPGA
jgi:hypothetical protein